VGQGFAATAAVDPDTAKADGARCRMVEMRTRADMHDVILGDAQLAVGVLEDGTRRLVGVRLLGRIIQSI
jgi:hypothetical protein